MTSSEIHRSEPVGGNTSPDPPENKAGMAVPAWIPAGIRPMY